jgi:hypothetical protein
MTLPVVLPAETVAEQSQNSVTDGHPTAGVELGFVFAAVQEQL